MTLLFIHSRRAMDFAFSSQKVVALSLYVLCPTCSKNTQHSSFLLRDKGYPLWPEHKLHNKAKLLR